MSVVLSSFPFPSAKHTHHRASSVLCSAPLLLVDHLDLMVVDARVMCLFLGARTLSAAYSVAVPAGRHSLNCGAPTSTALPGGIPRSRQLMAQDGWTAAVDESGATYYYNLQTGVSQWDPPDQQGYAQQGYGQALWVLAPDSGVYDEYTVRNGEEQVLGRYDMVEPSPYVSRVQCLVRVAPDGTATVTSLGKPQTYILKAEGTVVLGKDQSDVLKESDQIALHKDHRSGFPEAIYTVYAQHEQSGYGVQQDNSGVYGVQQDSYGGYVGYGGQQGGYGVQQDSYGQQGGY